ncbi:beta-1,3-1,4-glucanase, partial [Zopfochytrium polystomum]
AGAYTLVDTFAGPNFFDNFDFFSAADPTHGTVQYVSQQDATAQGLISAGFPTTISADARNVQPEGRHSVRISSKKSYTSGLFLFDITHMPAGCGTWPAVWMLGPNWPTGGELDILENVNLETLNHVTLHTSAGCALDTAAQVQTGTTLTTMCESPGTNSNAGCGVQAAAAGAYGAAFNAAGGGVYAAEWTAAGFKVWFFPRATIPADVAAGMGLSPAKWGTPMAHMPFGAACSADHFKSMQIIINLTFCGDWAGALYGNRPGCPAPTGNAGCQSFVVNNPAAFNQSYWSINSIKTFAVSDSSSSTDFTAASGTVTSSKTTNAASAGDVKHAVAPTWTAVAVLLFSVAVVWL